MIGGNGIDGGEPVNGGGGKFRASMEKAAHDAIATMAFRGAVGLLLTVAVGVMGFTAVTTISVDKRLVAVETIAEALKDHETRIRGAESRLWNLEAWVANERVGVTNQ